MNTEDQLGHVAVYDTQGLEEDEGGVKISELCKMLQGKYQVITDVSCVLCLQLPALPVS